MKNSPSRTPERERASRDRSMTLGLTLGLGVGIPTGKLVIDQIEANEVAMTELLRSNVASALLKGGDFYEDEISGRVTYVEDGRSDTERWGAVPDSFVGKDDKPMSVFGINFIHRLHPSLESICQAEYEKQYGIEGDSTWAERIVWAEIIRDDCMDRHQFR